MRADLTNPTLARIYTTNENIKGILKNLESIMDSRGYSELYDKYLKISKRIPKNEVLTEEEEKWGSFGVDTRYISLANELSDFSNDLIIYNIYKELSDISNDIKKDTKNIFRKDKTVLVDDYIEKNKRLMSMIVNTKNDDKIHQFTDLLDQSIKILFNSLKTLSFIGKDELLIAFQETNSDYLREHLASKIREFIDISEYRGSLEEDYVDASTIHECAIRDKKISSRVKEAREYEEKQAILVQEKENHIASLKGKLEIMSQNIEKCSETLLRLKISRNAIKVKKVLFSLALVPVVMIPLSCPFFGNKIGKNLSSKVLLTKTYTTTVDMDTGEVISSSEDYKELNTSYVASVTIFDPWKKNISGSSYSRNGIVYDYTIPEEDLLDENFHLTPDTIDYNNLVKKYPIEVSTASVSDSKYLTDNQIYVTETYQDFNDVVPSTKYNTPYTVGGIGVGVILGTTEVLAYYLWLKNWIEQYQKSQRKSLKENEEETINTNKTLKLTLEEQKSVQKEYDNLTKSSIR